MAARALLGRAARIIAAAALAFGPVGCSMPPAAPPAPAAPLVWPDTPDERPRVAFVTDFSDAAGFGIRKRFLDRVGEVLFGASQVRLVRPAAVLAVGNVLYVADPGAQGVHRFDPDAGRHDLIVGAKGAPLPSPVGLAAGSAGEVYVTDSRLGDVLVIRPGARAAVPLQLAGLQQPTGIAYDPAGDRLLVVDTAAHRVKVFARDGTPQAGFGGRGTGQGAFNYPTLLARDAAGRLYVTDSLNFRVQVFDAQGRYLRHFGQAGDGSGDNMRLKGVAVDSWGHVYVVDSLFSALQVFDDRGRLLLSLGTRGSARGEFWMPVGVFIDAQDRIYIADSYNRRIQVLRYIGGPT